VLTDDTTAAVAWDDVFVMEPAAVEWVAVDAAWGWQWDVQTRLAMLLDAQIPATIDTRPFAEMFGWYFGTLYPVKILVPPSRAREAHDLLAAGCDDPEFGPAAEAELQELWDHRPWLRFTWWGWRVYACSAIAQLVLGTVLGVQSFIAGLLGR
jgi:hypothetical protein